MTKLICYNRQQRNKTFIQRMPPSMQQNKNYQSTDLHRSRFRLSNSSPCTNDRKSAFSVEIMSCLGRCNWIVVLVHRTYDKSNGEISIKYDLLLRKFEISKISYLTTYRRWFTCVESSRWHKKGEAHRNKKKNSNRFSGLDWFEFA